MSWFRKKAPKFKIGYQVAFIEYVDGVPDTYSFEELGPGPYPEEIEFTMRLKKGVVVACDDDGVSIRTDGEIITRRVAKVRYLSNADDLIQ
jgi:hypothetical protein